MFVAIRILQLRNVANVASEGEKIKPGDIIKIWKKAKKHEEFVRVEFIYRDREDPLQPMKIACRQLTFRIEDTEEVAVDSLRSIVKATVAQVKKKPPYAHAFMYEFREQQVTNIDLESCDLKRQRQRVESCPLLPGAQPTKLQPADKVSCIVVTAKSTNGKGKLVSRCDLFFGVKLSVEFKASGEPLAAAAAAQPQEGSDLPPGWERKEEWQRENGAPIYMFYVPHGATARSWREAWRMADVSTGGSVESIKYSSVIYPNKDKLYR